MSSYIVRYAEIGLKGGNRSVFEKKLVDNISACLDSHKVKYSSITRPMGRVLIEADDNCDCLKCVFGISSFSPAVNVGSDFENVKAVSLDIARKNNIEAGSFAISCQRLDKNFKMNSQEFCVALGAFINEQTGSKVNLKNPDVCLFAEIIQGSVYLFTEKIAGPGGLPLGIEGNVVVLLNDEKSLLCALLLMKRGCSVFCVSLKDFDISLLNSFSYGSKVELKLISGLKEINGFAESVKAKAILVSDVLGNIEEYDFSLPVYRPLAGYDDRRIEDTLNDFRKRVC